MVEHYGCNTHRMQHGDKLQPTHKCSASISRQGPTVHPARAPSHSRPELSWAARVVKSPISKNPPFEVDQAISRESNYKRLRVWLENAGFEHTPICPCATNNSLQCHLHCVCPYGRKRAELITLVGGPDAFWGTTVRRPDRRRRP